LTTISHLPSWAEITREERFFTCALFNDMRQDCKPLWTTLGARLGCSPDVSVVDVGFEVCFFRDVARAGLIERNPSLEKQTFDLVLTLSNGAVVIIEAKAQQCLSTSQARMLRHARELMQVSSEWPAKEIYLVALCSSKYTPRQSTREYFEAFILWKEVATFYPDNEVAYRRADSIYGD